MATYGDQPAHPSKSNVRTNEGETKREKWASMFLQGLLSGARIAPSDAIQQAVKLTDQFIEELNK